MNHSFNTDNTYKRSSIDGDIMLIELPRLRVKIKILEKLPELEPPEDDDVVHFKFAPTDKLTPPLLQLEDCSFGYSADKPILKHVNIDVTMESRIGLIGPNGAGKSTLLKLLIAELQPIDGRQHRNSRLRISYFSQHHVDQLDLKLSPVSFLAAECREVRPRVPSTFGKFWIDWPNGFTTNLYPIWRAEESSSFRSTKFTTTSHLGAR
ncbi:hypothetical protein Pst134EA_009176 [Puccinia striiformis f. sp. tritici]|uniref:hypothetical protein n=1 Tax=Puccinia striiformis f. sp. tritici TaxID=168172 RepID=UPI0020085728|nr:hypothetical protein Pst134EA_009176 [Puccinia striiformis f. sp. tritici]KAH9468643.1 hypothetical protein Pst134EA_009176 [Puccinia striiformis f. sp. tritici]